MDTGTVTVDQVTYDKAIKLLNLLEGATTEGEATRALNMLYNFISKHRLTMADVKEEQMKRKQVEWEYLKRKSDAAEALERQYAAEEAATRAAASATYTTPCSGSYSTYASYGHGSCYSSCDTNTDAYSARPSSYVDYSEDIYQYQQTSQSKHTFFVVIGLIIVFAIVSCAYQSFVAIDIGGIALFLIFGIPVLNFILGLLNGAD